MNFDDYIGYPLSDVEDLLKKHNIKYNVVFLSEYKKEYDTYLVVKFEQKDVLIVYVDKFLLNI